MEKTHLKELYDAYGYAVYNRCLRFLGNPADAHDTVQDVFFRALRYGSRFDGKNPLGWLYRIADRQCFDRIKKDRNMIPVENTVLEVAKHGSNYGDLFTEPLWGFQIKQIIFSSRPEDARAAVLYYVDEMTQEEIASELKCSRKKVRTRLARFRDLARLIMGLDQSTRRER